MTFEWDDNKASVNLTKHGVGFDEAETVFAHSLAGIAPDPDDGTRAPRDHRWALRGRAVPAGIVYRERCRHPNHQCPRVDTL
jgi:uncharacterized DUF497 family protein